MSKAKSPLNWFREVITIDPRALAAFRVVFGWVLLFDFLTKCSSLTAFYTDLGILPRALAIDDLGWWSFSFHMASGAFWFQALLMIVGVTLAVAFILGYQTRLVSAALWLFVVSLQNRNYLILHSGDALLRLLLFWAMFLPLGSTYSLDQLANPRKKGPARPVEFLANAGILLQMFSIYFFTAILKNHPKWNQEFTALYYAMNLEQYTTYLGHQLLRWPGLMKLMTASTYYLELIGPLAVVTPWLSRYARFVVPFSFIGLHFGLVATMNLGMFPWVCIAGWLLFLPPEVWNYVQKFVPDLSSSAEKILKLLPEPYHGTIPKWGQWFAGAVLVFAMFSISLWNVLTLPAFKGSVPAPIRSLALPLRLDQYWCMFAPYPMREDGWFVVDGTLQDSTSMDTWNGTSPVNWDKPEDLFVGFRSTQWRKYLGNIWREKPTQELQLAFGKYVCREWNRLGHTPQQGKRLQKFDLYYMQEMTPQPGETAVIHPLQVWHHDCFASPDAPAAPTPPEIKN